MTTLEAPKQMSRREVVSELLGDLPRKAGIELAVEFEAESYPTTSFVDELIRQTLAEGRAAHLTLLNADDFTVELARVAAERYEVVDRLVIGARL